MGVSTAARSCWNSPRSTRSRSPRTSAAKRRSRSTPIFCTPRPREKCWKTRREEGRTIVYQRTDDPGDAPDKATYVEVGFERGDAVAVDGEKLSPATLLARAQRARPSANGIGRLDLVENRFVGMKSRGMYETPGGTILLAAHRGIEQITLDRGAAHLKDELMPRYAELIYNGFWFSPEREMLQAAIDKSQEFVTGTVRLKLYKGNVSVVGRASPIFALRPGPGDVRGRQGRLRPARRGRLHQAKCAAAADAGAAQAEAQARLEHDPQKHALGLEASGFPRRSCATS